jgi:hypothetical protein
MIPDPLCDGGKRKIVEGAAQVSAGIALLEDAGLDDGERRARHDAHLSGKGDGAREAPSGDCDTHAALDDYWIRHDGFNFNRR